MGSSTDKPHWKFGDNFTRKGRFSGYPHYSGFSEGLISGNCRHFMPRRYIIRHRLCLDGSILSIMLWTTFYPDHSQGPLSSSFLIIIF